MEIQQSNKFTLTKQNLDSSRFLDKTSRQIQFYTWVAIVLSHKPLLLMMMMYFRQCLFKFIQIFRLRYDAFKDGGIISYNYLVDRFINEGLHIPLNIQTKLRSAQ